MGDLCSILLNGDLTSNLGRAKLREEDLAEPADGEPDDWLRKVGRRMTAGTQWIDETMPPVHTGLVLAFTQIFEKLAMTLFAPSDVTTDRSY